MTFDTKHWKFQTDERVVCFLGDEFGWRAGTIHGISVDHVIQIFIVRLDLSIGPYRSVTVPASQIRILEDVKTIDYTTGHPVEVINGRPTRELCCCTLWDEHCVEPDGSPL